MSLRIDPALDLLLRREIEAPAAKVWRALTEPELVQLWFAPAPFRVAECGIDLRPGGAFRTVMEGPDGARMAPYVCCYLEIAAPSRLVWTSALGPGWRPKAAPPGGFVSSAVIELEDLGGRTRYSALAVHGDPEAMAGHEAMGWLEGAARVFDQMAAVAGRL